MSRPVGRSAALCCLVSCSPPSHAPDCMSLLAPLLDCLATRQSVSRSFMDFLGRLHRIGFHCFEHAMALEISHSETRHGQISGTGMTLQATPLVAPWPCSVRYGCYASFRQIAQPAVQCHVFACPAIGNAALAMYVKQRGWERYFSNMLIPGAAQWHASGMHITP